MKGFFKTLCRSARGNTRVRPNSSAELFGRDGRTAEHLILTKIVNMDHFCEIRYVYNSLRDIHFCVIRFLCFRKQFPKGRYTHYTGSVGQPTPIMIHSFANSCSRVVHFQPDRKKSKWHCFLKPFLF